MLMMIDDKMYGRLKLTDSLKIQCEHRCYQMRRLPSWDECLRLVIDGLVAVSNGVQSVIFPVEKGVFSLKESVTEQKSVEWLIHSQDWKWNYAPQHSGALPHTLMAHLWHTTPLMRWSRNHVWQLQKSNPKNRRLVVWASISLRLRAKSCIIMRRLRVLWVLTASEGGSSPAVEVSRQEDVNARGALWLTGRVIKYGLLPQVMHEKPTEGSESFFFS